MSTTSPKPLTLKAQAAAERAEAVAKLLTLVKPGDKITCVLRHKGRSGMTRSISLCIVHEGEIFEISWLAARVLDNKIDRDNGGIKVSGCGMDMGFHLVYNLGRCLWPLGTEKTHSWRNGKPDNDGGYALKSQWL